MIAHTISDEYAEPVRRMNRPWGGNLHLNPATVVGHVWLGTWYPHVPGPFEWVRVEGGIEVMQGNGALRFVGRLDVFVLLLIIIQPFGTGAVPSFIAPSVSQAQDIRPFDHPQSSDRTIDQAPFQKPTRIEGRLLVPDTYDDAIWLQLTQVYDGARWHPVTGSVQILVYARDTGMMEMFRKLPRGTTLRMIIQRDQDGKRRILGLDET